MDYGPFIDDLPIEHGDFQVRKLLVDQRVLPINAWYLSVIYRGFTL